MKKIEPKIDRETYELLNERAWTRVAELGFTEEERDLLLWISSENFSGRCPEGWDEEKGTVFVATASKERIVQWLEDAYARKHRSDGPDCSAAAKESAR